MIVHSSHGYFGKARFSAKKIYNYRRLSFCRTPTTDFRQDFFKKDRQKTRDQIRDPRTGLPQGRKMKQRFTWASAPIPVLGQPGSQRLILRRVPARTSRSSSSSSSTSSTTPASPPGSHVRSHTQFSSHNTNEASKEQRRKTLAALSEVVKARPPKRAPTEAPEAGPSKCISTKLCCQALPGFSPEDGVESRPGVKVCSPRPAVAPCAAPQRCPPKATVSATAAAGQGPPKGAESPRKRRRITGTDEDHLENPEVSSAEPSYSATRAALHEKYTERDRLGEGGYGAVYAGYRNKDMLPVAIKHIPQSGVERISIKEENIDSVPLEVVMMQKVQSGTPGTSAAVALLDWYDLEEELILVLERPVPCVDLFDYMFQTESPMPEREAKILTKQLIDALIEIHSKGVFHNDIKVDNILIECGSAVPRVRVIDFGFSTFLTEGTYHSMQGTPDYSSPEWFVTNSYRAEPATVWQLAVVVYTLLHGAYPFENTEEIISKELHVKKRLSNDCKDFLLKSLSKNPETRPTLAVLRDHPWLA
ncbi:serine/threonine-protein kinase pim-1-like [Xyrichtys novacula]|uniref:non-specific serine/threonine protein kinase n=1 Tax=Xyrichtys novacula TaxID=13765 RepID=A0AAV1FG84_XYRNO|nr:serine/threonine-protein kinase pim-1-like [Xyrichtys novacula]